MNPSHKVTLMEIALSPSNLGVAGRVLYAAKLGQMAPQSSIYTGNAEFKTVVDNLVKAGSTLGSTSTAKESARQAYFAAIGAEAAAQIAYDVCAGVFRAAVPIYCKTPQDLETLGGARKVRGASVPLIPPVLVTGRPDKDPGSIYVHAHRIPGLTDYILAVSPDPVTATSFVEQPGTGAIRRLTGLVSGNKYWLKYCTQRGSQRSTWSAAIPVIAK